MAKKHILVLGLKTFGLSIVKQLSKYNCEVLAIDKDMDRVEEADEYATHALQIDTHDTDKMDSLSLNSFDVAIITIDNIEESIMSALLFQEKGIQQIIVKSTSQMHKKILEKMGVDKIISPETEMGIKLAKSIMNESVIDAINFSDDYSIVEINALEKWIGKSLNKISDKSLAKEWLHLITEKIDNVKNLDFEITKPCNLFLSGIGFVHLVSLDAKVTIKIFKMIDVEIRNDD